MLPLTLANNSIPTPLPPVYVYCIGCHEQKPIYRPKGFPVYQILFTRKGYGSFRIFGDEVLSMTPGTVLLLGEGVPHEYYPSSKDNGWELGFIGFQGEAASSIAALAGLGKLRTINEERMNLWEDLVRLWHIINSDEPDGLWKASSYLYNILITLQKEYSYEERQSAAHSQDRSNKGLQIATRFLQEHYNENIRLSNVARAIGYSSQHFYRLFVNAYGMTPGRYLQMIRLRRSLQLFQHYPGISVDEVAVQVGMETSYFIKMFKKIYGTTPKQYVKRYMVESTEVAEL
jgi:AraC-like DNA-binding protein